MTTFPEGRCTRAVAVDLREIPPNVKLAICDECGNEHFVIKNSVGRPAKPDSMVQVPLRVKPEVAGILEQIADDLVVSPAWVVRRAIDRYLADLCAGNDLAEALTFQVEGWCP
jgi:predicted transcriptional regulator